MTDKVKVRLDKWLWAARFYRTRSLANAAVQGGKVHLNGNRVKPSHFLVGDEQLEIRRGEEIFSIVVLGLSEQRQNASVARMLYQEHSESITRREEVREQRALVRNFVHYDRGKPSKSMRRQARKIRRDPFATG